jgi:hypothetical protein
MPKDYKIHKRHLSCREGFFNYLFSFLFHIKVKNRNIIIFIYFFLLIIKLDILDNFISYTVK